MKLSDAFEFARESHEGQTKKGTALPFLYRPMAIASLVYKYGGDEAQASAALLHDTLSSPGVTPAVLEKRFGAEVARLVNAFSAPEMTPEVAANWRAAKEAYLAKLRLLDERSLLLVLCAELHLAEDLLHDLRYQGQPVWDRYPVHGMELFWYFREIARIAFGQMDAGRYQALISEISRCLLALKAIVFDAKPY